MFMHGLFFFLTSDISFVFVFSGIYPGILSAIPWKGAVANGRLAGEQLCGATSVWFGDLK